jgi:translation initiation factor IF-2
MPVKPVHHPKPVTAKPVVEKTAVAKPVHDKPHAPAVTHVGTPATHKPAVTHPVKSSAPVPAKPVLTPKPASHPTSRPAAPKAPAHISPYKPGQTNKPSYQAAPPPPRPNRPEFGRPRPNTPRPGHTARPDGSRPGQPNRPDFSRPGQGPRPDGQRPGQPGRPDFSRPGQPPRPDGSRPAQPNRPDFSRPGQGPRPDGQRLGQPGRTDNARPGQGQPFRPGQRPGSSTMYQGRPGAPGQRPTGPGGHQPKTTVVFPRQKTGVVPPKRQRDQDTLTQSIFPVTDAVPIVVDATKRKKDIGREREKQRERALDKWVVEEEHTTAAGKHKQSQRDSDYISTGSEEEKSAEPLKIQIAGVPTVQVLAQKLNIKPAELLKKAFISHGKALTINSRLDEEVIFMLAADYDAEVEFVTQTQDEELLTANVSEEDKNFSEPRGPVVTIMGHVDHGKTSLLDAIRHTNVTAGEFGGITQHIGAYDVKVNDRSVVFLDTPGHEAFTAMRARGAKVTDIVVLVVSAVDGMMPQTVEAIHHAQAANVPILVAINKIDLPESRPDRIKQQLSEHNLVPEDWGGKTVYAEVSAKKKIGLEHLLEMLLLQADIMELKCNPKLPVSGTVIEAKLDKGRGPVATVLIDQGTLRAGDPFVAGVTHGKVRAMLNDKGRSR